MKHSETIGEISAALAEFNAAEISLPKDKTATIKPKDTSKQAFGYKYADLATVLAAVRPPLAEAGLSILQEIRHADRAGTLGVSTLILHRSGEWLEFDPVWIDYGTEPKELGIAITYVRRYALMAALSLAPEDDGTPPSTAGRSAAAPAGPRPASTAQIAKIRALAGELGVTVSMDGLTISDASTLIERLLAEQGKRAAAAAAAGADPQTGELPPAVDPGPPPAPPAEDPGPPDDDPGDYWPPEGAPPDEDPPGMDAEEFRERNAGGAA